MEWRWVMCWLVGWLAGLAGWLVGWLVSWLVGWLVCMPFPVLVGWLVGLYAISCAPLPHQVSGRPPSPPPPLPHLFYPHPLLPPHPPTPQVSGKPIKFVGVGEKMDALEPFYPERMASRILGMGDMLTLYEKAADVVKVGGGWGGEEEGHARPWRRRTWGRRLSRLYPEA